MIPITICCKSVKIVQCFEGRTENKVETTVILFVNFVVQVLSGVLTAGLILIIGGAGVLRALHRRLLLVEDRIEDTDKRITTEVKRRASLKALEARDAAPKSPQELAKEHLSNASSSTAPGGKPSVVSTIGQK